jgi:hypothetical protein
LLRCPYFTLDHLLSSVDRARIGTLLAIVSSAHGVMRSPLKRSKLVDSLLLLPDLISQFVQLVKFASEINVGHDVTLAILAGWFGVLSDPQPLFEAITVLNLNSVVSYSIASGLPLLFALLLLLSPPLLRLDGFVYLFSSGHRIDRYFVQGEMVVDIGRLLTYIFEELRPACVSWIDPSVAIHVCLTFASPHRG